MDGLVKFCPECGSPHLGPHCPTATCDLWKCRKCGTYGTPDGVRVVPTKQKET